MEATSAISLPYCRWYTKGRFDDSNPWKACPASCSRVRTSDPTPLAFMKMKGRFRHGNDVQNPPGRFPARLSRSSRFSSRMMPKFSPKDWVDLGKDRL
jgi:hypothetical protein